MFVSKIFSKIFNTNDTTLNDMAHFMFTLDYYNRLTNLENKFNNNSNNNDTIIDDKSDDALLLIKNNNQQSQKESVSTIVDISNNICEDNHDINTQNIEEEHLPIIPPPIITHKPLKENRKLIMPRQQDTIFWALYIIKYGYDEYQMIQHNYGVVEIEIKQRIVEAMKSNPSKYKHSNYKLTKSNVSEIMSELLTNRTTSYMSLTALCNYYELNVILINEERKTLLEFFSNYSSPIYYLYKDKFNKYKLELNRKSIEDVAKLKLEFLCLDSFANNIPKPLKGIGNYKTSDLEAIARKLGIYDATKKYKKQDLYVLIFNWCTV